jgi:hypothetical protein
VVSRTGVILTAVIGSGAAALALIVARLWPKDSDTLVAGSAKFIHRWRRFTGLDD